MRKIAKQYILLLVLGINFFFTFINLIDSNNFILNERTKPIDILPKKSEGTNITGLISTNMIWYLSGSPYYIIGNVSVDQEAILTIKPGVEVLFNGSNSLIIDGVLNATGTPKNPIIFSSNATNPQKADWDSILIKNKRSTIKNAKISYANNGIKLEDGLCEIYNNTFYNNTNGVFVDIWDGLLRNFSLNIYNNTFFQNKNGIYIYRLSEIYYSYSFIKHNRIFNNSNNGIYITGVIENDLSIQNNRLFNNSGYGIQIELGASSGWKFINKYNDIFKNGEGGIYILNLDENVYSINYNNIYNNSNWAINCVWQDSTKVINATNNWWGTSNYTKIEEELIFDNDDDSNYARVNFIPFLTSALIETYNAEPPRWSNLQINDTFIKSGDILNISIEVIDNIQVDNVWIEINETTNNMTNFIGTNTFYSIFIPTQVNKTYNFIIFMNDTSGHFNSSESSFFVLVKPANFILSSDADNPESDGKFNLSWTISVGADKYSIFVYDKYITVINNSLINLASQIELSPYEISILLDGIYYYVIVAYNNLGYTVSNCISVKVNLQFLLSSDAGDPDIDGNFNLTWINPISANNFSVYYYTKYITAIHENLTILAYQNATSPYPFFGLSSDAYYFIIVGYNNSGSTLSNCLIINVHLPTDPPNNFILSTDTRYTDKDGNFNLIWTKSYGADNYTVYFHDEYITEINENVSKVEEGITTLLYSTAILENGVYFYIVISYNKNGMTSSNCITIEVQLRKQGEIPQKTKNFIVILLTLLGIMGISGIVGVFSYEYYLVERKKIKPHGVSITKANIIEERNLNEKSMLKRLRIAEKLIQKNHIHSAMSELTIIIDTAKYHKFNAIVYEAQKKMNLVKEIKIKKSVLELGTKYNRLQVREISEKCGESEDLIISTVNEMIQNNEIYAKYLESSKSITFNQQANIKEFDKLRSLYTQWQEDGTGKNF